MKWHYLVKKLFTMERTFLYQPTLCTYFSNSDVVWKQSYRSLAKLSNGKQEINFDVQKISMLDLSKLTHDFFVAIRIEFPKS